MEHLHDILSLQINNFNSFFNSCNNLQCLSGKDNILWMIVAYQVPPALYMAQWLQSGSGHIIDHLNIELL